MIDTLSTSAARWREAGEPDPHGDRYDCERAALFGGKMTDDEVANAVYLSPDIQNLTAAKDRIRWLSRALEAQIAARPSPPPAGVTEAAVEAAMRKAAAIVHALAIGFDRTAEGEWSTEGAALIDGEQAILAAIPLLSPSMGWEIPTFQARVEPWMDACFGPEISGDKVERGDRFLEEVFETLQSGGYDPARIVPLRDYVWSRPVGEPSQEVGGVMVTLAAYCLAFGLDMHAAAETELARIWTKVEKIRAKQAAKPRFSPLPIALPPANGEGR